MAGGMTFYQICWFFLIYSVTGWVVEVVYCTVTTGKIRNRGFLNGPVCPVYGFGMLALLAFLHLIVGLIGDAGQGVEDANALVIFFGAMILASTVELIAGYLLDIFFHARWWDYRKRPFNLNGYICLQFSILWGLGGVFVIRLFHPTVEKMSVDLIPQKYGWILLALVYAVYLADFIVTVMVVRGMNRYLKELDDLQRSMHRLSDAMSEKIGTQALKTQNIIAEGQVQSALARAEIRDRAADTREELEGMAAEKALKIRKSRERKLRKAKQRYIMIRKKILQPRVFGTRRLLDAFPDLQHRDYDSYIAMLRNLMEGREDISGREEEPERKRSAGKG